MPYLSSFEYIEKLYFLEQLLSMLSYHFFNLAYIHIPVNYESYVPENCRIFWNRAVQDSCIRYRFHFIYEYLKQIYPLLYSIVFQNRRMNLSNYRYLLSICYNICASSRMECPFCLFRHIFMFLHSKPFQYSLEPCLHAEEILSLSISCSNHRFYFLWKLTL